MNQNDYLKTFGKILNEILRTTERKNSDYAKSNDAFANFRTSAKISGVGVERGILVRMADKFARIENLLFNEAKVKEESIEDTLIDLAVYAIILTIYRRSKYEKDDDVLKGKDEIWPSSKLGTSRAPITESNKYEP